MRDEIPRKERREVSLFLGELDEILDDMKSVLDLKSDMEEYWDERSQQIVSDRMKFTYTEDYTNFDTKNQDEDPNGTMKNGGEGGEKELNYLIN